MIKKRVKNLVNIGVVLLLCVISECLFASDVTNYAYVDKNHAVSNMNFNLVSGYTYSLFCTATQKTMPCNENTKECTFCHNSIEEAKDFVKDEYTNKKVNEEKYKEEPKSEERLRRKELNRYVIIGFLVVVVLFAFMAFSDKYTEM